MKIALITDQHFGGKSDSNSFNDYIKKFYVNQFFPYLEEYKNLKFIISNIIKEMWNEQYRRRKSAL